MVNIISVIDNTLKGGASQAVQNFNIMYGFPEETAIPGVEKKQLSLATAN